MDTFETYQDRIDQYIDRQMSEVEKTSFESELVSNPDLQKQYQATLAIARSVREADLQSKLKKLKSISQKKPEGRITQLRVILFRVAAALTAVVALIVLLKPGEKMDQTAVVSNQPEIKTDTAAIVASQDPIAKDTEKQIIPDVKQKTTPILEKKVNRNDYIALAKKLFLAPTNFAMVVRSNTDLTTQKEIENLYKSADFQKCINTINESTNISQVNQYIKAHCLYQLNKYSDATNLFETIADDEYHEHFQDSQIYLAITYLMLMPSTEEKLVTLCNKNIENDHIEKSKFQIILNSIRK